jgi:hypothetical protein
VPSASAEEGIERNPVGESQRLSPLNCSFELGAGENCGEIEQRARHGRHRDPVDDGHLVRL